MLSGELPLNGSQRPVSGDPKSRTRTREDYEVQGQYSANFKPASGVHTYTVKVLFGGFEQASKTFTTK